MGTYSNKKRRLFKLIAVLLIGIFLFNIGCDQSNSNAYGWDDATATPDGGDAMNSGNSAPARPTPSRPTPAPVASPTPAPTPEAEDSDGSKPTPSPHVHNWEVKYEETKRKVRRTVEEVIYTCSICGHSTDEQPTADAHANSTHTSGSAHIISAGVA